MSYAFPGNVRELAHELERSIVFEDGEDLEFVNLEAAGYIMPMVNVGSFQATIPAVGAINVGDTGHAVGAFLINEFNARGIGDHGRRQNALGHDGRCRFPRRRAHNHSFFVWSVVVGKGCGLFVVGKGRKGRRFGTGGYGINAHSKGSHARQRGGCGIIVGSIVWDRTISWCC